MCLRDVKKSTHLRVLPFGLRLRGNRRISVMCVCACVCVCVRAAWSRVTERRTEKEEPLARDGCFQN